MKRERVRELHYITPVVNVPSILELGILSHRRAESVPHDSIAMQEVQDLRAGVRLPNGRMLHEHVNLYFDARNPMMYRRKERHRGFVVLRVDPCVLDLPHVIISDGNAARQFTRFALPDEAGFALLDEQEVYSEYWTDPDPAVQYELKRIRCAEVLVPDRVPPAYIAGVYCSCDESEAALVASGCTIGITRNEHLFFFGPRRRE
jgi:hypothetical protein